MVEAELLHALKNGQPGAATVFYKTYSQKLRRLLLSKIGNQDDAEELLQDIFIAALDGIVFYHGNASLKTWLYAIAKNKITDYYRKHSVRKIIEKTVPVLESLYEETYSPELVAERELMKQKIRHTFAQLPKRYQEILKLRYEWGYTVKQIAYQLRLSVKACESLLFRARTAFILVYETI